MMHSQANIR